MTNYTDNIGKLERVEQQLLGFYYCYKGCSIEELLLNMKLTKEECKEMCVKGMIDYLPEELGKEIVAYINTLPQSA